MSENPAADAFARFAARCPHRIELPLIPRPANALNVEIIQPMPRCRLKTPAAWKGADPRGARWLASGGDAFVFGVCSAHCALGKRFCDTCGHDVEAHTTLGSHDGVRRCRAWRGGEPLACECEALAQLEAWGQ